MDKATFEQLIRSAIPSFLSAISTQEGKWIVRGVIDLTRRVMPLPSDTKVISKIIEMAILPKLQQISDQNGLAGEFSAYQNHYPDLTLTHTDSGIRFAIDIKSTYRISSSRVNGMTLGTYTGYFRERDSLKNIRYPYNSYHGHYVLGVIYSRRSLTEKNRRNYAVEDIEQIPPLVEDFQIFFHEKYRIASDTPGSGNTRNIGSVVEVEALMQGRGPFADLGEAIFDDYWMNYETPDMARRAGRQQPRYTNLASYQQWKERQESVR